MYVHIARRAVDLISLCTYMQHWTLLISLMLCCACHIFSLLHTPSPAKGKPSNATVYSTPSNLIWGRIGCSMLMQYMQTPLQLKNLPNSKLDLKRILILNCSPDILWMGHREVRWAANSPLGKECNIKHYMTSYYKPELCKSSSSKLGGSSKRA